MASSVGVGVSSRWMAAVSAGRSRWPLTRRKLGLTPRCVVGGGGGSKLSQCRVLVSSNPPSFDHGEALDEGLAVRISRKDIRQRQFDNSSNPDPCETVTALIHPIAVVDTQSQGLARGSLYEQEPNGPAINITHKMSPSPGVTILVHLYLHR